MDIDWCYIEWDIKSKLYENVYEIFSKCSQLSLYYTLGDDFDRLNKYWFSQVKCQISACFICDIGL